MAGQSNNPQTPMGGVKAFACRCCGGQVQLRAPGQTLSAVCDHCGAIADLTDDNFKVISEWSNAQPVKPVIPLGTKGKLEGKTWEVIGVVLRQAEGYDYFWQEYLLFNPYHGFRFLVNNYGHWSLIKMLVEHPGSISSQTLTYEGNRYKRFTAGNARIAGVMGEFYWQVKYDDRAATVDFVSPPYMLSMEVEDGGLIWSKGEYIPAKVVQEAFGIEGKMPKQRAIAMNQPNPHGKIARALGWIAGAASVIAIVLQVLQFTSGANAKVYEYSQAFNAPNDTLVSRQFVVAGGIGNIELQADLPMLDNSWFEVEGYLHNVKTLENYGINLAVEYYAGVTDGESWTEGSRSNDCVINGVPAGIYEFVASISTEKPQTATIRLVRNVPIYSNFLLVFFAIWVIPSIFLVRSKLFETSRWAESG